MILRDLEIWSVEPSEDLIDLLSRTVFLPSFSFVCTLSGSLASIHHTGPRADAARREGASWEGAWIGGWRSEGETVLYPRAVPMGSIV